MLDDAVASQEDQECIKYNLLAVLDGQECPSYSGQDAIVVRG